MVLTALAVYTLARWVFVLDRAVQVFKHLHAVHGMVGFGFYGGVGAVRAYQGGRRIGRATCAGPSSSTTGGMRKDPCEANKVACLPYNYKGYIVATISRT